MANKEPVGSRFNFKLPGSGKDLVNKVDSIIYDGQTDSEDE